MTDDLVGMPEDGGQTPAADQGNADGATAKIGTSPAKNRGLAGQWQKGESGNPAGRRPGVTSKATAEVRSCARRLVTDEAYLMSVQERLLRGTAGALEPLLWHYAWGRPVENVKIDSTDHRPATILFLKPERWDPLADAAPPAPRRMLPPPPAPTIAEVDFELDGIDLPPKEERP